jgi:hypothetical protein
MHLGAVALDIFAAAAAAHFCGCAHPETGPCDGQPWYTSFAVEYCGQEPTATDLAGEGACAEAPFFCAEGTPCVRWVVASVSGPGVCVLVVTVDGHEYRTEVELVEVRQCPSRWGPVGGSPVRVGPDCADAG